MSEKIETVAPPCATWKAWFGEEVEGDKSCLGKKTLFIRSLEGSTFNELVAVSTHIERVWFCKEFRDYQVMTKSMDFFEEVCIEITADEEPHWLWGQPEVTLFLKVPTRAALRPKDFVCVGLPFADHAFRFETGKPVNPTDYLADVRLL